MIETKILRLKDGLDVISQVEFNNRTSTVVLTYPMMFEIRGTNLALEHWLPIAVMKGRSVTLRLEEVICEMEVNDDFKDYYENTVKTMEVSIEELKNKSPDELEQEYIQNIFNEESPKGKPIH